MLDVIDLSGSLLNQTSEVIQRQDHQRNWRLNSVYIKEASLLYCKNLHILKTCPCNIHIFLQLQKFHLKNFDVLIFLLKS